MKRLFSRCKTCFVSFFALFGNGVFAAQDTAAKAMGAGQPDVTGSLLKITLGLGVVVVAIFASAWFFKRFTQFSTTANGAMKVLGGLSLGPREKVVLIKVGEEQVLVGVAPGRVQTLHVLKEPVYESGASPAGDASFAARMGAALKQLKSQ